MTKLILLTIVFVIVALNAALFAVLTTRKPFVSMFVSQFERKFDASFISKFPNDQSVQNDIERRVVPNQVIYYWCAKSWERFEFRHYLSMYSVIRLLHPDVIYFLYDEYPKADKFEYNVWLDDLRQAYPFIYLEGTNGRRGCNGTSEDKLAAIVDELSKRGGFYVNEVTVLSSSLAPLLEDKQQMIEINCTTGHGFLMTQKGLAIPSVCKQSVSCPNSVQSSNYSSFYCVNVIERLYPKYIWELDSEFGRLARWAAYGERELMRPEANYQELAPNIAHYVWIGNGTMDYLWYLSVLSVLNVVKVDKVFIHGEAPHGKYWDRIAENEKVEVIYRYPVTYVFDQLIVGNSHQSDVWRVDIMTKYGGLYLDVDVIFVKPLSDDLRAYDAVMSIDFIGSYWIEDYPNVLQSGVMLGKRGSQFWVEFQKTMRKYKDDLWTWNACHMPYRVKEKYPRSLLIDKRLQVNCFCGKCHPTWWPGYKKRKVHHLNSNSLPNWRNDAYSYHFTGSVPIDLQEEGSMAGNSTSIFGEMARYIMDKSGLIYQD
ncbi:hypothetical protein LSH36_985g01007 [Paralvinella palmiformis]|uniref:Alpha 1,4-glycosyltransferase domain-containing protein n=1 Tax=Paralvinella palmiformis TaxID=53620 RepID=A0AAD9MQH3_9ANNE|nr:hypothetical protein LSH36_985g01007 [Paralvinella palmiformis]